LTLLLVALLLGVFVLLWVRFWYVPKREREELARKQEGRRVEVCGGVRKELLAIRVAEPDDIYEWVNEGIAGGYVGPDS
jgi:hypothetical protein